MATSRGTSFLAFAAEACRRLGAAFPDDTAGAIDRAEQALGRVRWQHDADVAHWAVCEPFHGAVTLACLADMPLSIAGRRFAEVLPELAGLAAVKGRITFEHAPLAAGHRPTPLLDRVIRSLTEVMPFAGSLSADERALVTTVLLFSDVAKGGTPEQRQSWRARLGVDGTVHNEDSAVIFEDVFRRILSKIPLSEDGRFFARARVLCQMSGLCGMRLRGEVPREVFAPLLDHVRTEPDDGARLGMVWSLVNRGETAAVRPGLWTDELAEAFATEEQVVLGSPSSRELGRSHLVERLSRMRGGSLIKSPAFAATDAALDKFGGARRVLENRLAHAQVWYAEPVLGALTLPGAARLLLYLSGVAVAAGLDMHRPWHLDLLGMVDALRDDRGGVRRYPTLLLETLLLGTPLDRLLQGRLGGEGNALAAIVSLPSTKGGDRSLAATFAPEGEAGALITLLSAYESKASAAFHATLKALCDLYRLRKDDFDRVANESNYLASMNASRSDKARMLDHVKPGTIVDVGPGGGVLLEMLADRFPANRIVGIDASSAVCQALIAARGEHGRYEIVEGDAFRLPDLFGEGELSTVIFCSVLHEIFSYVPWGEPPKRFNFASVEAIVRAAFKALRVGGRLIARDGVMPPAGPVVLSFLDAAWADGFRLFVETYEARHVDAEVIDATRVRLDARDVYEFLTTFTWGPASFPYEIREQRAVLPRDEYARRLLAACEGAAPGARAAEVAIPEDLRSYLQPGYLEHLRDHVALLDETGTKPIPLFDITGVWVIERKA